MTSSGSRNRLRRVQRTAAASSTIAGSAFSNASALGTKSTSDHTRITAWLPSATNTATRTSASPHVTINDAMSSTSNTMCAGIQKRARETPPLRAWMMPGRLGHFGSITRYS